MFLYKVSQECVEEEAGSSSSQSDSISFAPFVFLSQSNLKGWQDGGHAKKLPRSPLFVPAGLVRAELPYDTSLSHYIRGFR